jgi:hypothetical protein
MGERNATKTAKKWSRILILPVSGLFFVVFLFLKGDDCIMWFRWFGNLERKKRTS